MKIHKYSPKDFVLLSFMVFFTGLMVHAGTAAAADIDELVKNLYRQDRQTQLSAVEELGRMKEDRAVEELLKFVFIKAEDWRVKIRAIRFLGDIPGPIVSDRLVSIFNNPFLNEECPAMKWNTAIALGKDFNKGSRAVDSLIEALDYNNLLIREAVIQSLGRIGDPKAVPFLIPSLNDKNFAIKFSTIKALENIGDSQAIPFLRQIRDSDDDVLLRDAAREALRNFIKG